MANGKWNGMMTQKHIGYTSWNDSFEKDTCPKLLRVAAGSVISGKNGVIEIETPYYSHKTDAPSTAKGEEGAKWVEIPFMGKSLAGMTLMPYTKAVKGASISYKFKLSPNDNKTGKVRIHVITKSTLDYQNKGGMTYGVSIDGQQPILVNFNERLNEKPENIYDIYYPTIASRIIDKVVETELPVTQDGIHTLTLTPNDPAIIFEKIVVEGKEL